jgi:hypothetical protein
MPTQSIPFLSSVSPLKVATEEKNEPSGPAQLQFFGDPKRAGAGEVRGIVHDPLVRVLHDLDHLQRALQRLRHVQVALENADYLLAKALSNRKDRE